MVNQDQMPCIEVKMENERIDLDLTSLNIIKGLSGAERGHGAAGCRAGAPDWEKKPLPAATRPPRTRL